MRTALLVVTLAGSMAVWTGSFPPKIVSTPAVLKPKVVHFPGHKWCRLEWPDGGAERTAGPPCEQ